MSTIEDMIKQHEGAEAKLDETMDEERRLRIRLGVFKKYANDLGFKQIEKDIPEYYKLDDRYEQIMVAQNTELQLLRTIMETLGNVVEHAQERMKVVSKNIQLWNECLAAFDEKYQETLCHMRIPGKTEFAVANHLEYDSVTSLFKSQLAENVENDEDLHKIQDTLHNQYRYFLETSTDKRITCLLKSADPFNNLYQPLELGQRGFLQHALQAYGPLKAVEKSGSLVVAPQQGKGKRKRPTHEDENDTNDSS